MLSDPKPWVPDVIALSINLIGSVGFIMVKKQLMSLSGRHIGFPTTLTGIHVFVTALMGMVSNTTGPMALKYIPRWELFKLSLIANLSMAGMNFSLMLNSVHFYQIAKLSTIPVLCVIESFKQNKRYSREVKISVVVVAVGVVTCSVNEFKNSTEGFMCACVAALSTCLLQIYMGFLQKKYSIGSFDLLSKSAPIQAVLLILLGPFVDYYFDVVFFIDNEMTVETALFILLLYALTIFCNISQYICIGRLHSVAFRFSDHMETICVVILGWALFDPLLTLKSIMGVIVTVVGSVIYSWAVEVENVRISGIKDDTVNNLVEEETTLLEGMPDAKPVKDTELGKNDM